MQISVVAPVYDETDSLKPLCQELRDFLGEDLFEIFLVVSPNSSPATFEVCRSLSAESGGRIKIALQQGARGIGIAYREGISYCRGTHILCIDSDGEMETATAAGMRDLLKADKADCVTASRWAKGGGFEGYGKAKYFLNGSFQKIFRVLFGVSLTDLTYGYKMFRADLCQRLPFQGVRHEFACEGTLLPVRLGLRVVELPTHWTKRKQGKTKNRVLDNFRYVSTALRLLFTKPQLLPQPFKRELPA